MGLETGTAPYPPFPHPHPSAPPCYNDSGLMSARGPQSQAEDERRIKLEMQDPLLYGGQHPPPSHPPPSHPFFSHHPVLPHHAFPLRGLSEGEVALLHHHHHHQPLQGGRCDEFVPLFRPQTEDEAVQDLSTQHPARYPGCDTFNNNLHERQDKVPSCQQPDTVVMGHSPGRRHHHHHHSGPRHRHHPLPEVREGSPIQGSPPADRPLPQGCLSPRRHCERAPESGPLGSDPLGHTGTLHRQCDVMHRQRGVGPLPESGHCGGHEDPPGGCAGCGGRIADRYFLQAVDQQWHVQCLKCSDCQVRLDSELTCYARHGHIYCKEDYYRRFAIKRCSRCHTGLAASELVMRAREHVFHLACFACSACARTLTPGEEFGLRDGLLYCRTDYEVLFQGDYIPALTPAMTLSAQSPNANGSLPFYNGVGAVQKGRPRKRKSPLPDVEGCTPLGLGGLDVSERGAEVMEREAYGHTPPRQKRVRTSFKHHQLRTMKSYFALNHNPDAKDLKQLAQKTGLSKRVLQVWFQNARAKYRRNLLKQQSDSDKNGSGTATSPSGTEKKEGQKEGSGSLTDISSTRSPALSDISSTPSLSDLHSSALDSGGEHSSSSITELFSSTIASIN